jgi:hypothetical protein
MAAGTEINHFRHRDCTDDHVAVAADTIEVRLAAGGEANPPCLCGYRGLDHVHLEISKVPTSESGISGSGSTAITHSGARVSK